MGDLSKPTIEKFRKAELSFRKAASTFRAGRQTEALEVFARDHEHFASGVESALREVMHLLNLFEVKLDKSGIRIVVPGDDPTGGLVGNLRKEE